ncbi:hypothetical protein JDV02_002133 [Purpureocillium takamizusanense]|uniref:Uncharacterized protein n=1 Tax=Purpureocillium takamizusanense TaxID=2060973 RepID=A0A9Q8QAY1_9HYPO|nr:uncharacterized protein JDV02_002133 [Purpureocillium takamizusanense]UNI15616.1 hypothetical protein JDV02_002133 [Purpureocillium takamizusanense]
MPIGSSVIVEPIDPPGTRTGTTASSASPQHQRSAPTRNLHERRLNNIFFTSKKKGIFLVVAAVTAYREQLASLSCTAHQSPSQLMASSSSTPVILCLQNANRGFNSPEYPEYAKPACLPCNKPNYPKTNTVIPNKTTPKAENTTDACSPVQCSVGETHDP